MLHVLQLADADYRPSFAEGIWSPKADTEIPITTLQAAIGLVEHLDRWAFTFQAVTNASDEERCMLRLQELAEKSKCPVPLGELQRGLSSKERKRWKGDFIRDVLQALECWIRRSTPPLFIPYCFLCGERPSCGGMPPPSNNPTNAPYPFRPDGCWVGMKIGLVGKSAHLKTRFIPGKWVCWRDR